MKLPRLLQLIVGLASLFPLCLPARAQFLRVAISDTIPIDKLETMNDALQIADPAPRLDLLKRLGVDANVAEAATSARFSHDIEIQPLRTHSGKLYGIVSLPCGLQVQTFLYLLDNSGANTWHVVDHIALDCFHQTPTYQLLSLAPGEDSIFVHHAHSGHGAGEIREIEDKAALYTIRNGRIHEVLSTLDYISRQEASDSSPPVEQKSSFLQLSSRVIEETRITSKNGSPIRAERRVWRWSMKQEVFSATPFHVVPE